MHDRANLVGHPAFQRGWFEVQDLGSQRVSHFVDGAGRTVLDLCAGAGGKALALAAAGAHVTATDVRTAALQELRRRAKRAGAVVRTVHRTAIGHYDRVLVDAPCSGSGVWRRHPEYRWRLADGVPSTLQSRLLAEGADAVAPGGELVYATCSVFRAENEAVVEGFLATHPAWRRLRPDLRLAPHTDHTDGLYAAALGRAA